MNGGRDGREERGRKKGRKGEMIKGKDRGGERGSVTGLDECRRDGREDRLGKKEGAKRKDGGRKGGRVR